MPWHVFSRSGPARDPLAIPAASAGPALAGAQSFRIVCREAGLEELLGERAIDKVDMVLADSPVNATLRVRAFSHLAGESGVSFSARPANADRLREGFPRFLRGCADALPGLAGTWSCRS